MHEAAQESRCREPDQHMDVVRHHDEADATGVERFEFLVQDVQEEPLRMVKVQESTAAIDRECDEVRVKLVIDDSSACHLGMAL
jgi:hypothetical protein